MSIKHTKSTTQTLKINYDEMTLTKIIRNKISFYFFKYSKGKNRNKKISKPLTHKHLPGFQKKKR